MDVEMGLNRTTENFNSIFFYHNANVTIHEKSSENDSLAPLYTVKYVMNSQETLEEISGELEYYQEKYFFYIEKQT